TSELPNKVKGNFDDQLWGISLIANNGTIRCWGAACGTQPGGGYGCRWMNLAPAGTYKDLAAGDDHSCAIATSGAITCWGNNWSGKADAPAGAYKSVVAGRAHSCAIATDDTITCWGDNRHGQTDAPAGGYKSLGLGGVHSCAIATDDTITCWGSSEGGHANPPRTEVEVAATQALDPIDLSGRSRADFVSSDVPAFDMIDVATGDTVNLRSVVHGRTPILLWLYSPY
ncbi:MAG: RCC1 domain-containing protein, partial [bacterium]|nr:RCC1 domain-containing protein [bacterium]